MKKLVWIEWEWIKSFSTKDIIQLLAACCVFGIISGGYLYFIGSL